MKRFFRNNGLSLVLFFLFFCTLVGGQSVAGRLKYNEERKDHGKPPVAYLEYVRSDHFLEATAENWESEFLQMFVFVLLTSFLYQKGSAESRDPEAGEDTDDETLPHPEAPAPVKRGGWRLKLYSHSLSLTFLALFIVSVLLHAAGGAGEYSEDQMEHGSPGVSMWKYMTTATFWFESLQNWQSEFLAVWAMVVFSIFLREKGSPESKAVNDPHSKTGR